MSLYLLSTVYSLSAIVVDNQIIFLNLWFMWRHVREDMSPLLYAQHGRTL